MKFTYNRTTKSFSERIFSDTYFVGALVKGRIIPKSINADSSKDAKLEFLKMYPDATNVIARKRNTGREEGEVYERLSKLQSEDDKKSEIEYHRKINQIDEKIASLKYKKDKIQDSINYIMRSPTQDPRDARDRCKGLREQMEEIDNQIHKLKDELSRSKEVFSDVRSFSLEDLTEKECLDKLTFKSPSAYYNCMNSKSYGFYACSKSDKISNYGDTSRAKYIYDGCPDDEYLKVSSVRVPKSKELLKSYEAWINAFLKYNRVRSAEIQLWDEEDNNVKDYIEVVHMIHGDSDGCDCIGSYKGNTVFIRMKVVKS